MPHKPDVPCSNCGNLMWRGGPKAVLAERPTCRPCRKLLGGVSYRPRATGTQRRGQGRKPNPPVLIQCTGCLILFLRNPHRAKQDRAYCSRDCFQLYGNKGRSVRSADDPRRRRQLREQAAPGLTQTQRRDLGLKWRHQARRCTYCPALATTVDHVLPLVRGGTNFEGNLTPCCKRCNSSKAGWTVVEWRTGRRLPPMTEPLPWCFALSRPKPTTLKPCARKPCPMCAAKVLPPRLIYCTERCATEAFNRYVRDKYRRAHGLPVDPARPTKAFALTMSGMDY